MQGSPSGREQRRRQCDDALDGRRTLDNVLWACVTRSHSDASGTAIGRAL
jgi:hypothetical protein